MDGVLDIHETDDFECPCQITGVLMKQREIFLRNIVGRQNAGTVSRVHSGMFDMLHDPAADDVCSISDGVDVKLLGPFQKPVDEDGTLGRSGNCRLHVLFQPRGIVHGHHRPVHRARKRAA